MQFARRVFAIAGAYGIVVLTPLYFLEDRIGRDTPPPITHAEFLYGFVGVALAWQVAFFVVARDPLRHRPMMIPCVLEKLTWGLATIVLFAHGRLAASMLGFGLVDLALGALFALAFVRTAPARA
jgi:hypothetical protein